MTALHRLGATELAGRIASGAITAEAVVSAALARIAERDGETNAFTATVPERALRRARALDAQIFDGETPGPLAGVPFAVKNLFDVAGVVTLAGSRIERQRSPATEDAFAVTRMEAAGAVCVGCLNMDEYAYGFTTENSHDGATRNPHDLARSAGGSSGGSAAAVAAGLVALSLGTDTNGSIRVPAALCGVFGLKPTLGRLSRAGVYPFVPSLDHVGPFARSVDDLALAYRAMQGRDRHDPAQQDRAPEPLRSLRDGGIEGLRIARLGGYFAQGGVACVQHAADRVAAALAASDIAEFTAAAAARSAAFIITAAEGAHTHLANLRTRAADFDPHVRDRLLAGALIPAQWLLHAQRIRAHLREAAARLFAEWDILVAPATPSPAMPLGHDMLEADDATVPLRPSFGRYTQPISFLGLPVLAVPVQHADGALPVGVQLIGAPWRETSLLRAAAHLERTGLCAAPIAPDFA